MRLKEAVGHLHDMLVRMNSGTRRAKRQQIVRAKREVAENHDHQHTEWTRYIEAELSPKVKKSTLLFDLYFCGGGETNLCQK